MNALARIVSVVLHPLLMATYLFSILAWALPTALSPLKAESHITFIVLIFILTFLLPVLNLSLFRLLGTVKSLTMANRKERILPFLFITTIYLVVTYLFYAKMRISFTDSFLKLMLIIDLLVVVSMVTTFFFKVSVHSVAIWGLTGITLLLTKMAEVNTLFYVTLVLILLDGMVMSARLQLGAHTSREVMLGSALGLATSMGGMVLLF